MSSQIVRNWSDIDLTFRKHPVTGDILKKKDLSSIITSMQHLLFTSRYERKFNHGLGAGINKLLFEPMDDITATTLSKEIRYTMKNFEPRVEIDSIDVVPDYDRQGYEITVTFFVVNSAEPITINLFMERNR